MDFFRKADTGKLKFPPEQQLVFPPLQIFDVCIGNKVSLGVLKQARRTSAGQSM